MKKVDVVNVTEKDAAKLSSLLNNKTSKKIIDFLSEKKATETELVKALKLPASTVHHNISQLLKTGIISVDAYHYSSKGREVNHYTLTNKVFLFAPQKAMLQYLASLLPALAIVITGVFLFKPQTTGMKTAIQESAVARAADTGFYEAAPLAVQVAHSEPNLFGWFVGISVGILILSLILQLFFRRR